MSKQKKYKVEFCQTETFVVDVFAKNEKEAIERAEKKWDEGDYRETGDYHVETGSVYDVTNTDDPFNP